MRRSGSLTVEASLVLPLFLFAMVTLAYLGQLLKCQDEVQNAMNLVASEASALYGAGGEENCRSRVYYTARLGSVLKGTGISMSLAESRFSDENDEIDLILTYRVKLPFPDYFAPACHFRQRVHTRGFTGVDRRDGGEETEHIRVYVTETGRVYHRSLDCTYLKLSISQIKYGDLDPLRNQGGGKYKACERCCREKTFGADSDVWITNYGDRFHSIRSCSGIKRNIREIWLSEAGNRTPCSKCGSGAYGS